jgi:tryptophan synthase beta chain
MSTFQLPTHFGRFGGCYAPETLMPALLELEAAYIEATGDGGFEQELQRLRRDFAGRATPLFHARRLSQEWGLDLWIKREDLLHTGAHKLNNALGQALLAKRMGKTRILAETGAGQAHTQGRGERSPASLGFRSRCPLPLRLCPRTSPFPHHGGRLSSGNR